MSLVEIIYERSISSIATFYCLALNYLIFSHIKFIKKTKLHANGGSRFRGFFCSAGRFPAGQNSRKKYHKRHCSKLYSDKSFENGSTVPQFVSVKP